MTPESGPGGQTVWFHLDCPEEPEAFLVVNDLATGAKYRIPMTRADHGRWEQCVALRAGRYRARCYAGRDNCVVYYGPAEVASRTTRTRTDGMDGLDAVVEVLPPREPQRRARASVASSTN